MREHVFGRGSNPRAARILLIVAAAYTVTLFTNAFLRADLDGESRALSSIVFDYAENGRYEYVMHAQPRLFGGIRSFILHPPLMYTLASAVVGLLDFGVWQLLVVGYVAGVLMLIGLSRTLSRAYGPYASVWIWTIAACWQFFYESALTLRPDFLVGVWCAVVVIATWRCWFLAVSGRSWIVWSAVLAAAAGLGVASHWNGAWLFVYLPLHLWLCKRELRLRVMLAMAGALACVGIPWLLLLEGDLLRGLYLNVTSFSAARIQGSADYRGIDHYMLPLLSWRGGKLVLATALFGVFACFRTLARFLDNSSVLKDGGYRLDLLLLIHAGVYATFAVVIRQSLQAAYLANITPLVLLFCARGLAGGVDLACRMLPLNGSRAVVTALGAFAMFATSPEADKHDSLSLRGVLVGEQHRQDLRAGLQVLVPETDDMLLGSYAYPYLPDSRFTSLWLIVAEAGERTLERMDLDSSRGYLWVWLESQGLLRTSIAERRAGLRKHGDVLVVTDHSYWWQWDFLDARVWQEDYVHVGTAFAFGQFGHQVFVKPELASGSPRPGLYRVGKAWVLVYGMDQHPSALGMMRLSEWRCLSSLQQELVIEGFLVEQSLYALIPTEAAERKALYGAVYDRWVSASERSEVEGFERTLMQAFSWEQDWDMAEYMRTREIAGLPGYS